MRVTNLILFILLVCEFHVKVYFFKNSQLGIDLAYMLDNKNEYIIEWT